MATAVSTLVQRTRRHLGDWPSLSALSASCTSAATTINVVDGTMYSANRLIEADIEIMRVLSVSVNTLTVKRGEWGSTATTHASGADVLSSPRFTALEYIDALADGIDSAFPTIYKTITDTSLTTIASTYEYTLPAMTSDSTQIIPYVWKVEAKCASDLDYAPVARWSIIRQATPKLHLLDDWGAGYTIRIHGYGQFPRLSATTDTLDTQWPRNLEYPLRDFAAATLLSSGEYRRVAIDKGVQDTREQANKTGSSQAASQYALQLYLRRVQQSGFPPMNKHVKRSYP